MSDSASLSLSSQISSRRKVSTNNKKKLLDHLLIVGMKVTRKKIEEFDRKSKLQYYALLTFLEVFVEIITLINMIFLFIEKRNWAVNFILYLILYKSNF